MISHGDYVENTTIPIRTVHDTEDSLIRILLLDNFYDRLKPLYDYFDWISTGVSVTTPLPENINECFDWLSGLIFEFKAMGVIFTIGLMKLAMKWVQEKVSIGKFTYENISKVGAMKVGDRLGGVKLVELPVEG